MNEHKKVHITIFQAPYASLLEHGLYVKMHDSAHPFQGVVPAEYYLPVFDGNINAPEGVDEEQAGRAAVILERVFSIFNTAHPAGYCGRSLSVGDIVQLEGRHYLCAVFGFTQVEFQTSQERGKEFPGICEISLPGGAKLVATSAQDPQFPSINISLVDAQREETRVCFVEHNPERAPGHELCIGVYCSDEDDTVYYDSYNKNTEGEDQA